MTAQLNPALSFTRKVNVARDVFRSVLGDANPDEVFRETRVTLSNDGRRLYEHTANNRCLAEAVLGADFPRVPGPVDLDHYTSFGGVKGIIETQQFNLTSVARRLHEGEFATFAREHKLDGYFGTNGRGQQVLQELSEDLFYLSMTMPGNPDEDMLWETVASGGRGACLHLRVTPRPSADLRRMGYQTGRRTALKRINDGLFEQAQLVYTPWTISRICAFYLPLGYRPEREFRLMLKRHADGPDMTVASNFHSLAGAAGSRGTNYRQRLVRDRARRDHSGSTLLADSFARPTGQQPVLGRAGHVTTSFDQSTSTSAFAANALQATAIPPRAPVTGNTMVRVNAHLPAE